MMGGGGSLRDNRAEIDGDGGWGRDGERRQPKLLDTALKV